MTRAQFGDFVVCLVMPDLLKKAIELGEVACLVDFGVEAERVLAALSLRDELPVLAKSTESNPVA